MATNQRLRGTGPKVTVSVEQDIIDQSERRDSSHCMIADAIKTTLPDVSNVSVDLATIRWTDRKRGVRYTYLTPPLAQRALVNFDQGLTAEPFTFRLHQALQVTTAGKRTKRQEGGSSGKAHSSVPTVMGGLPAPLGALASGTGAKTAESKSRKQAEKASELDEHGNPVAPNPALTNSNKGRVRRFGLRQLKP